MKKSTRNILIGAGIATAVGAITTAIICQLRVIKKLTTDIDEMTEEEVPMEEIIVEEIFDEESEAALEEAAEEAVAELAEEAAVEEA